MLCKAPHSPSSSTTYSWVKSIFQLCLIAGGNVLEQNAEPKTAPHERIVGLAAPIHLCMCVMNMKRCKALAQLMLFVNAVHSPLFKLAKTIFEAKGKRCII